jgi:hypothetical protein|tara:strand:+ start:38 stop:724 length:687 start_codon:yes stop_codon:yes gene_type:complete
MLPKIETPILKFELPSTGETLRFRPFLVKEEKVLMLASEGKDINDMLQAAQQVVSNCCLEDINVEELTIFDLQMLFINLKSKSVGQEQDFTLSCGECKQNINYTLDLDSVKVQGLDNPIDNFIKVTDEVGILLKYPTTKAVTTIIDDDAEIMRHCIEHIVSGEETLNPADETKEEMTEFIDNLPVAVYTQIKEFFINMPRVEHLIEFKCSACEKENVVLINGYEHFFD